MPAPLQLSNTFNSKTDSSALRWSIVSIAASILIGTAAYNYHQIDGELTSVALSRREAVAQLVTNTLSEKFGRSIDVAVSLSTRVQFRKLVTAKKWSEASRILRGVPSDFPYIDRVFIVDPQGTLQADVPSLPGVRLVNFASRDWYQGVSHGWQPYISRIYTREAAPQLQVFTVAVPIKSTAGQVVGILGLQIRIENLLKWLEAIKLDLRALIYLVDSKDQMVLHYGQGGQRKIISMEAPQLVKKMLRHNDRVGIGFDEVQQQESIISVASLPDYGWSVVVVQPVSSSIVLAARDNQLRLLLAGYGFILLLGIITAVLLLRIVSARRVKADLEHRVAERTTELQSVNKELEAFSYSVSHDLRAPLRSIDGFSQALLEDYADRLDDQARGYIKRVRAATQHMGDLIDDMLTLSRVTRSEMKRVTVDLSTLAADVLAELKNNEPGRKVDCRIESSLITVGDEHLLRVLLVNLLGNALKFTSKTANARIQFGARPNADGAKEFFVRDNGAGFDMSYAGKLFGTFQRLHQTSEFPGTGVGLATVQRIVHRHGGQVRAEGVPGQGATFYFILGN
jgi:signal transduction histidine kinase